MKRSETCLAVAFSILLLGYFGRHAAENLLHRPVADRTRMIKEMQREIDLQHVQCAQAVQAKRTLDKAKTNAVSTSVSYAPIYQNWLLRLGKQHQLKQVVVTPRAVVDDSHELQRRPFTVQATTTVSRWRDFLYDFYKTPVNHRIANMQLQVLEEDDLELMVTMSVELLAVASGGQDADGFAQLLNQHDSTKLDGRTEKDYAVLNEKGMFAKLMPARKPAFKGPGSADKSSVARKREARPKPDPGRNLVYIGGILAHGRREAWLYDHTKKQEIILVQGGRFHVAGRSGKVYEVGKDYVILEIGGNYQCLNERDNFAQLRPLANRFAMATDAI